MDAIGLAVTLSYVLFPACDSIDQDTASHSNNFPPFLGERTLYMLSKSQRLQLLLQRAVLLSSQAKCYLMLKPGFKES